MYQTSRRVRAARLMLAVVAIIGAGALVMLVVPSPPEGKAEGAATTVTAIRSISLSASATPPHVSPGQKIQVSFDISITGGPGCVKITGNGPSPHGGSKTASITVPMDANARWGFSLPFDTPDLDSGRHAYTVRATAVR